MRNRFKNSITHFYEINTGNVQFTIGEVGSSYNKLNFTVYSPNSSTVDVTDSHGVKTTYTVTSNNKIDINADAHLLNSIITVEAIQMSRFTINTINDYSKVSKIEIFEQGALTSLEDMANGSNLLTEFVSVDLPNVTNMNSALRDTAITSFPDIDVSGVTDVGSMFYGCSELTAINANFSNVTVNSSGWTYGANKLKCITGITTYNTTQTTGIAMFDSNVLVTPTEYEKDQLINNPDGYSYTKPAYLDNCSFGIFEINLIKANSTNNIDIRVYGLDDNISCTVIDTTGNSTTYTYTGTFLNITGIDVSGASDTINITMPNINRIILLNNNVKEAHIVNEGTLKDLSGFNNNYGYNFDTFTSVTLHYVDTVVNMFRNNKGLSAIPRLEIPFCRNYQSFLEGSGINSFPTDWQFNVATNFSKMFYGCSSLTTLPQLDFLKGTNFNSTFHNCSSLTDIAGITFSTDTSDTVNLSNIWYGCSSLDNLPNIDVSRATTMYRSFYNCSSLTYIHGLGTSGNVTDFYNTFSGCTNLVCLDAMDGSSSQTSNDPANVFNNCTSLIAPNSTEQVDIIDNNINWTNPNSCP